MRQAILGFVLLLTLGDSCGGGGPVGVQDYGAVTGRVLDATNNQPIGNAIVSVGSLYTVTADARGAFTLPRVPIGQQTVTARMPGFSTESAPIRIRKDQTAQAGYVRLVPLTKAPSVPTLPPPATPTPQASAAATWSPPTPTLAPTGSPSAQP